MIKFSRALVNKCEEHFLPFDFALRHNQYFSCRLLGRHNQREMIAIFRTHTAYLMRFLPNISSRLELKAPYPWMKVVFWCVVLCSSVENNKVLLGVE